MKKLFVFSILSIALFASTLLLNAVAHADGMGTISIRYQGVDNIYLHYDSVYSVPTHIPNCTFIYHRLIATIGGVDTVLIQGGLGSMIGDFHHTNLNPPQNIAYRLEGKSQCTWQGQTYTYIEILYSTSTSLDGRVFGTLPSGFEDHYQQCVGCGEVYLSDSVYVPSDAGLWIETDLDSVNTNQVVVITGTLHTTSNAIITPTLVLYGTANAEIDGSTAREIITSQFHGSLTLLNAQVDALNLGVGEGTAIVNINGSILGDFSTTVGSAGSAATINMAASAIGDFYIGTEPGSSANIVANQTGIDLFFIDDTKQNNISLTADGLNTTMYYGWGDHMQFNQLNLKNSTFDNIDFTAVSNQTSMENNEFSGHLVLRQSQGSMTLKKLKIGGHFSVELSQGVSANIDGIQAKSSGYAPSTGFELVGFCGLKLLDSASATASDLNCQNAHFTNQNDRQLSISNSLLGSVTVFGSAQLNNSEIGNDGITLYGGTLEFKNNISYGVLAINSFTAAPTIDGNSFWGPFAIGCNGYDFNIGSNYYGSPYGWDQDGQVFLSKRGSSILGCNQSKIAPPNPSGKRAAKMPGAVFPAVWMQNYIIGQNTLRHDVTINPYMIADKKTLLSLELVTAAPSLSGASVEVVFNNAAPVVVNNIGMQRFELTSPHDISLSRGIVDIILPEVPPPPQGQTTICAPLIVTLLTGGVSGPQFGRPTGDRQELINNSLCFYAPPKRHLSMGIQAVEVSGACSGTPFLSDAVYRAEKEIPARFAIREKDIDIQYLSPYHYYCIAGSLNGAVLATGVTWGNKLHGILSSSHPAVDRVIGVVPHQLLGSADGFTGGGMYVFVPDSEPGASALDHEFGHTLGLYTGGFWNEQYNQFPPNGLPYEGATSFDSYAIASRAVNHFPRPGDPSYDPLKSNVYDSMSASSSSWPIFSTLLPFFNYFHNLTVAPPQPLEATIPSGNRSTGNHTLQLFGQTQPNSGSGACDLDFVPGSLKLLVLDGTGISGSNMPAGTYWPCLSYINYILWAFDSSGAQVAKLPFIVFPSGNQRLSHDGFYWTFTIPDTATRLVLTPKSVVPTPVVFEVNLVNGMLADLLSPLVGATLGDPLNLSWAGPTSTPSGSYHIWYILQYSTDNGASWQTMQVVGDQTQVRLDSYFVPQNNQLIFRIISTDGLHNLIDQVNNLKMTNRPPELEIQLPHSGWVAPPSTPWSFLATSYDLEDRQNITINWTSSLDGALGSGLGLDNVMLSAGTHTITCMAQDSQGAITTRSVQISVQPAGNVDLALSSDLFTQVTPQRDPLDGNPLLVVPGITNTLTLDIWGGGVPITATVAVSMTVDSGVDVLMRRVQVPLDVFKLTFLIFPYLPHGGSSYTFTAAIEAADLPDPNLLNNIIQMTVAGLGNKIYLPVLLK